MTLRVSKHWNQPCRPRVIFVNFYNFLNNGVIMPSLVSTGNCKLGHDCRRVCSHRRRDETRQFRLVGVCGVYWALDTAMMWTVVLNCLAWLSMNCLLVYVCVCVYMYVSFKATTPVVLSSSALFYWWYCSPSSSSSSSDIASQHTHSQSCMYRLGQKRSSDTQ